MRVLIHLLFPNKLGIQLIYFIHFCLNSQYAESHTQRGGAAAAWQHKQLDYETRQAHTGRRRRQLSGMIAK